jgi:hypothetical protein
MDEGTAYAPPPVRPAPAIPLPPPVVAGPPPVPHQGAPPASPDTTAEKPRRRVRIKPAGWLVIILLLSTLLAAALVVMDRPGRGSRAPRPRPPDAPVVVRPPEPAGGVALARGEFARVTGKGGYHEDDTAYIVMAGSYRDYEMDQARRMLGRAHDQGFAAGLANSAVYPQLQDGYVVVVVGPYADRAGAQGAVSAVREHVAPDAFVKRVTIRRP